MLSLWIDSGATYPGTYGALGSGMVTTRFPAKRMRQRCAGCHKAKETSYRNVKPNAFYYQFGRRKRLVRLRQALVAGRRATAFVLVVFLFVIAPVFVCLVLPQGVSHGYEPSIRCDTTCQWSATFKAKDNKATATGCKDADK